MGYSHYLYRPKEINNFFEAAKTVKRCRHLLEFEGISIVSGDGSPDSEPVFNRDLINFNGSESQEKFSTNKELGLVWPKNKDDKENVWAGGKLVTDHVAPNGNGSYESVHIARVEEEYSFIEPDSNGNYFNCCKTAYRPYDILVMCCYLAIKYFDNRCVVKTDGQLEQWAVAIAILSVILEKPSKELYQLISF